ncbi:hypothetical protein QL285_074337 [Trifolium repens]|nr:hypothetical protein QL285_074337 [Trifolium repens]
MSLPIWIFSSSTLCCGACCCISTLQLITHTGLYQYSANHAALFTLRILDCRIPRALEKPPKLKTYGGTADPGEHVEHIDIILDYHQARGFVKCKVFVLTFISYIGKPYIKP